MSLARPRGHHVLGITSWENCPFWLRMADTRSVRPLGLLQKLYIVIGGHLFEISAVVLSLESPGAYPLLLGRPWLRSANIKQNWQHNNLSFRRGRTKVKVPMEESAPAPKESLHSTQKKSTCWKDWRMKNWSATWTKIMGTTIRDRRRRNDGILCLPNRGDSRTPTGPRSIRVQNGNLATGRRNRARGSKHGHNGRPTHHIYC